MIAEARRLAAERVDLVARCEPLPSPAGVMQRLTNAARAAIVTRRAGASREYVVRSSEGAIVARAKSAGRGGAVTISFPSPAKHVRAALISALEEILDQMTPNGRSTRRIGR
jgi:hypothetical protein